MAIIFRCTQCHKPLKIASRKAGTQITCPSCSGSTLVPPDKSSLSSPPAPGQPSKTQAVELLPQTICPHCWVSFPPEDVLWISEHADLIGDPKLGAEQQQRFLPTRFTIEGNALDARELVCQALACPRCHLPIPRVLLQMEPFFVSMLGGPACGKSFFLTAMSWMCRRTFPLQAGLDFTDADMVCNRQLSEYEETMFLHPDGEQFVPLANLIPKTETSGKLYNSVSFGTQTVRYLSPYLFSIQPRAGHPGFDKRRQLSRVLCLYDNAGEHFLAGQDSTSNPVTQHLTQSKLLLFLFDPTQDQRFRALSRNGRCQALAQASDRTSRQETVLLEAAARVRRHLGLPHDARHQRLLLFVVTKYDIWSDLLPDMDTSDPLVQLDQRSGLDSDRIDRRSRQIRELLFRICPEVVLAAEQFTDRVVYMGVSALGCTPQPHPQLSKLAIQPKAIQPFWATIPLLYGLSKTLPGLLHGIRRKSPVGGA